MDKDKPFTLSVCDAESASPLFWKVFAEKCTSCRRCGLADTRQHVVVGVGRPDTPVMLVGEAPGKTEDETGEPFTGLAGQLLDDMLRIIGLSRKNLYITNVIKCRPPKNRDPFPEEQSACMAWLDAQIEQINPKMIVCLGRIAAGQLIRPDYRITREHGQWVSREGRLYTAIYHPSALLRDPSKRPETFDDLKRIEAALLELAPEWMATYAHEEEKNL